VAVSVLAFLEGLAGEGRLRFVGGLAACVDDNGVISAEAALGEASKVF
jgi:hypothetical protein